MIYLLLFAGLFMGWSLGTNDAANAFGTAVSTGVIIRKSAILQISMGNTQSLHFYIVVTS